MVVQQPGRNGCNVTAQPSLPVTDKAARHKRQLIPLQLKGDEVVVEGRRRHGGREEG